jgi:hypothetical protein
MQRYRRNPESELWDISTLIAYIERDIPIMLSFIQSQATTIKFPSLIVPGGDVLIELSGNPNDVIIMPKAYLRRSGCFANKRTGIWVT